MIKFLPVPDFRIFSQMAVVIVDTEEPFVTGITNSAKRPKVAVTIWKIKRGVIAQDAI